MKFTYKTVFLALIAAILIAIPTATALNTKSNEVKFEKTKSNQLQFDLKKRDSELQKTIDQKLQTEQKLKEQSEENERLKRELQAKAERKAEEARIAAAEAEKQKAAVAVAPRASVGSSGNCESYRGLVAAYFPAGQVDNALLTMQKESGCRTHAVSPTNDHGLMQVNCTYHCAKVGGNVNALYDPETNIRLASAIYRDRGNWSAWYAVRGILW